MFRANVVLDSISPDGVRLASVEATYPRFIHSEMMTHRMFARNSASSRAIPWKRRGPLAVPLLEVPVGAVVCEGEVEHEVVNYYVPNCMYSMVKSHPVIPVAFGQEQRGMQAGEALAGAALAEATLGWMRARDRALEYADRLSEAGVHKSLVNRLVEPWMWITVLITATEWKNFFRLRCHAAAEVHMQKIAWLIREALAGSQPRELGTGEWHMPYVTAGDPLPGDPRMISAGRCARLSYLTHDGVRDAAADAALAERLINNRDGVIHASPFEHVASPTAASTWSGPFRGWHQFRKDFAGEDGNA